MKRLNNVRILIYSHDSFGLGHLRRCRTIAHALVEKYKGLNVLIISGSQIAGAFDFKARVDFVKIPSVIKLYSGEYTSVSEHIDIKDILAIRQSLILKAAESFAPDIFITDKEPLGLQGEIESTLIFLRGKNCKTILGLRDIMDSPDILANEWQKKNVIEKLPNLYDEIWIYGAEDFYNPLQKLQLPKEVLDKVFYMGFLARQLPQCGRVQKKLPKKFILITAGGGGDGQQLMSLVLAARQYDKKITYPIVMITGPFMQVEQYQAIKQQAQSLENIIVINFDNELENIIKHATAVVAMCGYNTFCEMLSFDKPALYLPRARPRREQLIRASRAKELGLAKMLDLQTAVDAKQMAKVLNELPNAKAPSKAGQQIDMGGLGRICQHIEKLCT